MFKCRSTVTFARSKTVHFSFHSVVRQSQILDVLRSTIFFFDVGLQHACCGSADVFIQNCLHFSVVCSYNTASPFQTSLLLWTFLWVFISRMIFQLIHHSFSMKYRSSTKSNISWDLKKQQKIFLKKILSQQSLTAWC